MNDNKSLRSLTIRLTDDKQREDIRYVMRQSGHGRAAQAMLFACHAYRLMDERQTPLVRELQDRIQSNNASQMRIIRQLREENAALRRALAVLTKAVGEANSIINYTENDSISPRTGE